MVLYDEYNLLDLNDDVLNIIGSYVKKDNSEKLFKAEQILNDKKKIDTFSNCVPGFIIDENENYINDINTVPKDSMKDLYFLILIGKLRK
jgi:hypothetical protein